MKEVPFRGEKSVSQSLQIPRLGGRHEHILVSTTAFQLQRRELAPDLGVQRRLVPLGQIRVAQDDDRDAYDYRLEEGRGRVSDDEPVAADHLRNRLVGWNERHAGSVEGLPRAAGEQALLIPSFQSNIEPEPPRAPRDRRNEMEERTRPVDRAEEPPSAGDHEHPLRIGFFGAVHAQ